MLYKEQEAGLPRRLPRGPVREDQRQGPQLASRSSRPSAASRSRRSTRYIAGFQYGAKAANPGIKLLNGYSGDFVAQDKCQGLAQQQIAQGSDIIFQVAGQCGLGAINAARDKGYWGIGVDTDQSLQIGSKQLLASATKGVDVSVVDVVGQVVNNKFRGGKDLLLGINEKGAGIEGINSAVPQRHQGQDERTASSKMKAGKVKIPTEPIEADVGVADDPSCTSGFRGLERRSGARAPRASRSASARSSPTTRSTSICARARCTPCSARTERASPR